MTYKKKLSLIIIVFLVIISIYKDLTVGISPDNKYQAIDSKVSQSINDFSIVKAKVHGGDNLLSIAEQLNSTQFTNLDIQKVIEDFQLINPDVDPYNLQINNFYYFPLYHPINN